MAEQFCKKSGKIAHFETSAKDNIGIQNAFATIINKAQIRENQFHYVNVDSKVNLSKLGGRVKKGCKC